MCLYSKEIKATVAEKDICCYKILDKKRVFKTPFQRYEVNNDVISGKENLKAHYSDDEKDNTPKLEECGYKIEDGFIHVINGEEESMILFDVTKRLFMDYIKHPVLFECVIPKGTEYYSGLDNNYHHGYAAKEIRFVKKIELEEFDEKENGVS